MPKVLAQAKFRTEPAFGVTSIVFPNVEYAKVGSRYKAVIDYQVIEKTKSYTTLRILYVLPVQSKRIT